MKTLTICIPDNIYANAEALAKQSAVDVSAVCSIAVIEHLQNTGSTGSSEAGEKQQAVDEVSGFDVAKAFPGFPKGSIRLAQAIVDEALKFESVTSYKKGRGIGFSPNFLFIEYLLSQGGRSGVSVSFYGPPSSHSSESNLSRGQGNYSRARISREEELNWLLPLIKEAHQLKFGD